MDWDKLRIFYAVAEAGSFTKAGDKLNLSQSAISRQISGLEASLKTSLFHRHARGLTLTEEGELLFRTAHDVFTRLSMAQSLLMEAREKPSGELRVTAGGAFGSHWLARRLREFIDLYPDIRIDLKLDERELDLSIREADIALRSWRPTGPDLIFRKIISVTHHIYASPDYLRRFGMPQSLADLDNHRLITYGPKQAEGLDLNWMQLAERKTGRREPALQINNLYGMLLAVESGLGVASMPNYMIRSNNRIVRILPDVTGPEEEIYLVYPEELKNAKRLTSFRDFILRKVAESRF